MVGKGAEIVLVDSATATTLAQVLPVLLLTLTVELRRTQRHRAYSKLQLALFFVAFGIVETMLIMSIDGTLYPFQPFDLVSALIIFGLLAVLFALSLADSSRDRTGSRSDT